MNLSYEQRIELLDLVKAECHKQWETILEIDAKFKCDDKSMRNDKELYWVKKQTQAYARKELLNEIRDRLILSL